MSVHAFAAGVLGPDEIKLLGEVFDETAPSNETELDREERAARLLGYFQAGIKDKAQLMALAKVGQHEAAFDARSKPGGRGEGSSTT